MLTLESETEDNQEIVPKNVLEQQQQQQKIEQINDKKKYKSIFEIDNKDKQDDIEEGQEQFKPEELKKLEEKIKQEELIREQLEEEKRQKVLQEQRNKELQQQQEQQEEEQEKLGFVNDLKKDTNYLESEKSDIEIQQKWEEYQSKQILKLNLTKTYRYKLKSLSVQEMTDDIISNKEIFQVKNQQHLQNDDDEDQFEIIEDPQIQQQPLDDIFNKQLQMEKQQKLEFEKYYSEIGNFLQQNPPQFKFFQPQSLSKNQQQQKEIQQHAMEQYAQHQQQQQFEQYQQQQQQEYQEQQQQLEQQQQINQENQNKIEEELQLISIKFCAICQKQLAKYKCPACFRKSCGLECLNQHKKMFNCDGKVQQEKRMIPKSEFNLKELQKDYNFIQKTITDSESIRKKLNIFSQKQDAIRLILFTKLLKKRFSCNISYAPSLMSRHRSNLSFVLMRNKMIYFTVELKFQTGAINEFDNVIFSPQKEDTPLLQILKTPKVQKETQNFLMKHNIDFGRIGDMIAQQEVFVFMKNRYKQFEMKKATLKGWIKRKLKDVPNLREYAYIQLEPTQPICELIKFQILCEYPTFIIVHKDFLSLFSSQNKLYFVRQIYQENQEKLNQNNDLN